MTQKEEPVVVVSKKNFFHKNLRWLIPLIVVVIAVGIVAIVININSNKNNQNVCSNSIINQAVPNMNSENAFRLTKVVAKITSLKNYSKDPNCLYIISDYFLNIHNDIGAKSELNQFNKQYNNKNLSSKLTKVVSVTNLRNDISNPNIYNAKAFHSNAYGIR